MNLSVLKKTIDDQAFSLVVNYHATLGYPTQISIDYDQGIADDEISYQLTDFNADITDFEKPQLDSLLILKDKFDQSTDTFIQGEEITFPLSVTNNGSGDALLNLIPRGFDKSPCCSICRDYRLCKP